MIASTHLGALPIDAAFDVEQRVDALDRFERDNGGLGRRDTIGAL